MAYVTFLTITEQVAEHLRAEIQRGRWSDVFPGKHEIAAELGVNNKTVEAALRILEKDGTLIPQGPGRRRHIGTRGGKYSRSMRIALLLHDRAADRRIDYVVDFQHVLAEAGHSVFFAEKTLGQLQFDASRVARLAQQTRADAWIIFSGPREVLEWFATQPQPAFALFGQRNGLRLPGIGPDSPPAIAAATRRLIALGHRRIVLLTRQSARCPSPSRAVRAFSEELQSAGITPGEFNLPGWEETNTGFQRGLEALFRITPPTALIVDEAAYCVATLQFLARRGIRVPGDVSLVSIDDDPAFDCCEPPIACIRWDSRPLVRRIAQWASLISRGKNDFRQTSIPSTFVEGGSIGPAKHKQ